MKECPECKYAMERDMDQDGDAVVYIYTCNHCGHFFMEYPHEEM